MKAFTVAEVAKHNKPDDVWIIIRGKVYDMTSFLRSHPGGSSILQKHAGTDATKYFEQFGHPPGILDSVGAKLLIGTVAEDGGEGANHAGGDGLDDVVGEGEPYGDLVPYADPNWYQGWSSPYYTPSHYRVRSFVRAFTEQHIMPYCSEWEEAKRVPRELYLKAGAAGLLACFGCMPDCGEYLEVPLPAGLKVEEFDLFHEFVIMDEIARCGSGGLLWSIGGGLGIGLPPVIKFGSKYIKDKVIADCIHGRKNICLAVTEPYAGSDVAGLRTEAKLSSDGKHYILNGEKKWITNGVFADFFTVACRTGGKGMKGISLLLVERTMPGVKTRQLLCSGVWSSGTSYITFDNVKVPVENRIGEENKGFRYIMYNFNHERLGLAIQATRLARVCYEDAVKYANHRKTFGKLLVQHDVIRNKLGHMVRQIEATHAWMEQIIHQMVTMPAEKSFILLGGPIALLKAQSTQTFEYCAREAAQIMGGIAYTRTGTGARVERLYREVRAYAIPGGSEEIMLDLGVRQSLKVGQMAGAKF